MSYVEDLIKLFSIFSSKRRLQFIVFSIMSCVVVFAEMITLGALVPFVALLIDPEKINNFPSIAAAVKRFGDDQPLNYILAITLGALIILSGLLRIAATWFGLRFSYGLGSDLASLVYSRTLHRPYQWFISMSSSQVIASVERAGSLTFGLITPMISFIIATLSSLGIIATLFFIDFNTALISSLSFVLSYLLIAKILAKRISATGSLVSHLATHRYRAIQDGFGGIREILLDGSQRVYSERFSEIDYTQKRAQASSMMMSSTPRFFIETLGMLLIISLTLFLSSKEEGISEALPFLSALAFGAQKLMPQVQTIYQSWASFVSSRSPLRDTVLFLSEEPKNTHEQITQHSNDSYSHTKQTKTLSRPLISIENISFSYLPSCRSVLKGVSLTITSGDRVGIVGETGSGKSTLIDLIMGLLPCSTGHILIDGEILNQANMSSWQRRIAHVPQSIFLTDSSIAENIAFGIPMRRIDMKRVIEAAERAQVHQFVKELPEKYFTSVGDRGIRLSGGQRQRIGIARALFKGADILVLDEATSALDDDTEKSVISAVNSLGSDLTVIMIAHRMTTLSECNVIYRVENLTVKRIDSYLELMAR